MAIDRETSFSVEKAESTKSGMASISSARAQRREDIKSIQAGGGEEYIKMLREQIEALDKLNNLRDSDLKKIKDANKLLKEQEEFQLRKDNDYEKYLKNLQEVFKVTEQLSDIQYSSEIRSSKNIEDIEKRKKAIKKIDDEAISRQRIYNNLLNQANKMVKTNQEASKSQLEAFTEGLHSFKDEIGKLAVIKGIGDLTQGLFDKNGSASMMNVYRNTSAQLGLSSNQFNSFKNDLMGQLAKSDNFFNFGWKDTADYLNRLGELNITSQEMAEEQYLAVMQGTKYLGLSTETQAKILKVARDTGNMDLLNETNQTIVQIMNAQLGVAKDQLDRMVSNSAEIADVITFLGGNGSKAAQDYTKIQAAVAKEYGQATATSADAILKEILSNPVGNKYMTSGFFGTSYNDIVNQAQSGHADEAYKLIIESIKSSRASQVAGNNLYAMQALGADNNIMAIKNSSGSMGNVEGNLRDINSASKEIQETIAKFNQDWSDKILNAGSNILAMLPFSQVLTLQNVFYVLALTELIVKVPKFLAFMTGQLKQIAINTGAAATGLKDPNSGLFGMLGKHLGPIAAIAAGVASIAMFVSDASSGKAKAKDWGTSETAATIGGFLGGTDENGVARTLKNAGKYALAGAAIGTIIPGVGNLVGAVVGGLIGLVVGGITGSIGGKNIARGLDSMFGGSDSEDEGGVGVAPSIITPHIPSTGGKGAATSSYPWSITSGFGPRTLSNGDSSYHNGVHWGIPVGTKIGTPVSGTVSFTQVDSRNTYPQGPSSAGSGINIMGDDGVMYQFWHLSSVGVKQGQRVNAGQLIGLSGNTGYSTGAHLHFGTKEGGSWKNPLNYSLSGLFNANGDKYTDVSSADAASTGLESKEGERLLETVISADTLSNQANAVSYRGMGSAPDVVDAVNSGFTGLNAKLEELSSRQNEQEEVLRMLSSSRKSSSILGY